MSKIETREEQELATKALLGTWEEKIEAVKARFVGYPMTEQTRLELKATLGKIIAETQPGLGLKIEVVPSGQSYRVIKVGSTENA